MALFPTPTPPDSYSILEDLIYKLGYITENTSGGGGGFTGSTGAGDASAANQQVEINRLEAIRDRLPSSLINSRLGVDVVFPTGFNVSASSLNVVGPLTDSQLRASAIAISAGTPLQVVGPLTNAELRSFPLGISAATALQVSGPLTNSELRATPIVISSSTAIDVIGPLTNTQLRASPVEVFGTFNFTGGSQSSGGATEQTLFSILSSVTQSTDYYPQYNTNDEGLIGLRQDPSGSLAIRGPVLTDEGTFRVNFANTSLEIPVGNVTVNGTSVIGNFATAEIHKGDYFKISGDNDSNYRQVDVINSATELTLTSNYTGSTSGIGSRSLILPTLGTGASVAVSNGSATLAVGTVAGVSSFLLRRVDYAPITYKTKLSISQRIINQEIRVGLFEPNTLGTVRYFARFVFTGTNVTEAYVETGRNPTQIPTGGEVEVTQISIPGLNGGLGSSATSNEFRIELATESVKFYMNGFLVATHSKVLPHQYDVMGAGIRSINSAIAPASNTNIIVDYFTVKNHNKLEIGIFSETENIVASPKPGVIYSQNLTALNQDMIIDCMQFRSIAFQLSGSGTNTVSIQGSNTPSFAVAAALSATDSAGAAAITTVANGAVTSRVVNTSGFRYIRFRMTAFTNGVVNIIAFATETPFVPLFNTTNSNITNATLAVTQSGAWTQTIGGVTSAFQQETGTPLLANVSFSGAARDAGATAAFSSFSAVFFADVSGTCLVQASTNSTNWFTVFSQDLTPNNPVRVFVPLYSRFKRVVYFNGPTNQGAFHIFSTMHRTT